MIGRMSCTVDVPIEVQREALAIVRGDRQATIEVGGFLQALQDNPLPNGRQMLTPGDPTAFYKKLECGVYVSWEIVASPTEMIRLFNGRVSPSVLVRVLGFGRDDPSRK